MQIPPKFRGYAGDPRSELEVVFLFGLLFRHMEDHLKLPFVVTEINDAFPDCEGINPATGEWVHIEFELYSSHYLTHQHPLKGCDFIVCWEDDWPGAPMPVISLKSVVKEKDLGGKAFLHIPARGSVRYAHLTNKERKPDTYDAINYFEESLIPELQERYKDTTFEEGTTHFLIRYGGRPFPLLEIKPNGKLFCKSINEVVKIYGPSVEKAARELREARDDVVLLKTREDANKLAKALLNLIAAIASSSTAVSGYSQQKNTTHRSESIQASPFDAHERNRTEKPETYDAVEAFLAIAAGRIRQNFPKFFIDKQSRHFVFRSEKGGKALLEIHPDGKLFCGSTQEVVKRYGQSTAGAADSLRAVKYGIGVLRTAKEAEELSLALEVLLKAIANRR